MAEIHVEPKKHSSPVWIWILVGLLIIGALMYFLMRGNNRADDTNTNTTYPTSHIQWQQPDAGTGSNLEAA